MFYYQKAMPVGWVPEAIEDLHSLVDAVSLSNDKDDLKKCVKYLTGAVVIAEGLEKAPLILANNEKLAMLYHRQEKHEEAHELELNVLLERRRELGDDNKLTIESCENMARIYAKLEKFTEAEDHINDVIARRNRLMGPDHRETIKAKSHLAKIYLQSDRYNQARQLYQDILDNRVRVLGRDHVETSQAKMNLSWVLYYVGGWDEAYVLAKEGREVIKEVLGMEHVAYLGADKLIKKIRRARPRYGHETTVPDPTERPPSPAGQGPVQRLATIGIRVWETKLGGSPL
jgi:tetratricopeptide (TPR) repeat protein